MEESLMLRGLMLRISAVGYQPCELTLSTPSGFTLQAEETRIVESLGGIEHREIRWRKATLDEAKTVLVSYHAQRNLTMTANLVVSAPTVMRRNTDGRSEDQDAQLKKNEASDT